MEVYQLLQVHDEVVDICRYHIRILQCRLPYICRGPRPLGTIIEKFVSVYHVVQVHDEVVEEN